MAQDEEGLIGIGNKLPWRLPEELAFFKCGLNCNFHEGMKTEVCQEMLSSTDK